MLFNGPAHKPGLDTIIRPASRTFFHRQSGADAILAPNKKVGSRPLGHATFLEAIQYNFPAWKTQGRPHFTRMRDWPARKVSD
jgi:hypothetical protein